MALIWFWTSAILDWRSATTSFCTLIGPLLFPFFACRTRRVSWAAVTCPSIVVSCACRDLRAASAASISPLIFVSWSRSGATLVCRSRTSASLAVIFALRPARFSARAPPSVFSEFNFGGLLCDGVVGCGQSCLECRQLFPQGVEVGDPVRDSFVCGRLCVQCLGEGSIEAFQGFLLSGDCRVRRLHALPEGRQFRFEVCYDFLLGCHGAGGSCDGVLQAGQLMVKVDQFVLFVLNCAVCLPRGCLERWHLQFQCCDRRFLGRDGGVRCIQRRLQGHRLQLEGAAF